MSSPNTAISRRGPSAPMKLAWKLGIVNKNTTVLDYGCGLGADVRWLRSLGVAAQGYDLHHQPDLPKGKFQAVTCLYVINVIPDKEQRLAMLSRIIDKTAKGGNLFLVSRSDTEVDGLGHKKGWNRYRDGWETSKGFQKGYSTEELLRFCQHDKLQFHGAVRPCGLLFQKI